MPVSYTLDLSGNSPDNLVRDELHTVSESHFRDYYFIVPLFAPFYVDNFSASISINGTTRLLTEDIDYSFALEYLAGTRTTRKVMYGGITLHNLDMNGILTITYQTIGGDHVADRLGILTKLADMAYNPRTTVWDTLTDVPVAFPPTPHYQDFADFYGQEELVTVLTQIRDAIATNSSLTAQTIADFLANIKAISANDFVKKSGDIVTGNISIQALPSDPTHAVTKNYVDSTAISQEYLANLLSNFATINAMITALNTKLDLSGGTMVGDLVLKGDPTQALQPSTKQYADNIRTNLESLTNNLQLQINQITSSTATEDLVTRKMEELYCYTNFLKSGTL